MGYSNLLNNIFKTFIFYDIFLYRIPFLKRRLIP